MKISVASQTQKTISGHLGHCLNFWIFETKETEVLSKTLLELSPEQSFHNTLPDRPHPLDDVDVLICGGMGKDLAKHLAQKGIEPAITKETDIDKAVAGYLDGSLVIKEAECGDRKYRHQHPHQHCHKHQAGSRC